MKKCLKIMMIVLGMTMLSTTAMARSYLNTGNIHEINDFEDYSIGSFRESENEFGAIGKAWSVTSVGGNMQAEIIETTDKDENSTKALHFFVDGASQSTDKHTTFYPLPNTSGTAFAWNEQTKGKYFVYKFDFKSGGSDKGCFKGNNNNFDTFTIDWSTGKVKTESRGEEKEGFTPGEWATFTYIIDRTGNTDVQYLIIESTLGKKEFKKETTFTYETYEIENRKPMLKNNWLMGGERNPSFYIDNIEIYVTDYSVSCKNNGIDGVDIDDRIVLDIEGDIDEASLDLITVSTEAGNVSISSIAYNQEDKTCVIYLDERMQEFTKYTVDFSEIAGETGLKKNFLPAEFTTTGNVQVDGTVALEKIINNLPTQSDKLDVGVCRTTFAVENNSSVNINDAVMIARLVKDGKIEAMAYCTQSLLAGGDAKLTCAFMVTDADCAIELFVKSSLNSTLHYTDIYRIDINGITSQPAQEQQGSNAFIEAAQAEDNSVEFYNLTLGENGKREKTNVLTGGLTECAASLREEGDAMLITVLKKDGMLKGLVYSERQQQEQNLHTAIHVPEDTGYTCESFVWDGLLGVKSYMTKTAISSLLEEN